MPTLSPPMFFSLKKYKDLLVLKKKIKVQTQVRCGAYFCFFFADNYLEDSYNWFNQRAMAWRNGKNKTKQKKSNSSWQEKQ